MAISKFTGREVHEILTRERGSDTLSRKVVVDSFYGFGVGTVANYAYVTPDFTEMRVAFIHHTTDRIVWDQSAE